MSQSSSGAAIPFKRPRRPRRRDAPGLSPPEIAEVLATWEPLHSIAAQFRHWQPGDPGRPPDVPPAAILLFATMIWACGSERKVERMFRHRASWEPVRSALAHRHPDYRGLQPGAAPISRSEYRRFRDTYGIHPPALDEFRSSFRSEMCSQIQGMGAFDPNLGSLSHPAPENLVTGDGTVIKPRFKAGPGDVQVDSATGAIEQRRHDPDAAWYKTGDGQTVRGVKFGMVEGRLPAEHERVILDVFPVETGAGKDEAARAMESIGKLARLLPALSGVVWDMALRGTHIDELYQEGLLSVVKVARVRGAAKSQQIGAHTVTRGGQAVGSVTVFAINGAPHVEVIAAGQKHPVRLERAQILRRKNKRLGWRWYCIFTVPDDALVPSHLRNGQLELRLHTNDSDRARKLNRAESLRPISEGDVDWRRLYALRPGAESINRWVKEKLRDSRAPAVGRARQHFALLCCGLLNNVAAVVAHLRRRGLPLPGSAPPTQQAV